MEDSKNKSSVDLVIGILVFVIVMVMIYMRSSEIEKENMTVRSGSTAATK